MTAPAIAQRRLAQQRLIGNQFGRAEEVVAWLGAIQAQEYGGATWSLGLRMQHPSNDLIEQAFTAGSILRTHLMRPTWHFVTPADIRWMLELTAPRVNAVNAYMYRQLELDEALLSRSNALIGAALEGGRHLTRAELGAVLAQAGIVAKGMRLGYIVHRAELDAVVCSGPRRGKQFTYALLAERAPQARVLQRDEALAELTRRYYTGHGPATIHDFVWWSGLTSADAKAGLALVASALSHEVIDGQTYYFAAQEQPVPERSKAAFLLPTYDEFLISFAKFEQSRRDSHDNSQPLVFDSTIVIDGQIVGSWRRTFQQGTVVIERALVAPLADDDEEALAAAGQRYADFVGMPVQWSAVQSRFGSG